MVIIKEIVKEVNVLLFIVLWVFVGSSKISFEIIKWVFEVIKKFGYVLNVNVKGLVVKKFFMVGVFVL